MVQKINPHPAPGCNRSSPYYVFSKDAILESVPSISSEVLAYGCVRVCHSWGDSAMKLFDVSLQSKRCQKNNAAVLTFFRGLSQH